MRFKDKTVIITGGSGRHTRQQCVLFGGWVVIWVYTRGISRRIDGRCDSAVCIDIGPFKSLCKRGIHRQYRLHTSSDWWEISDIDHAQHPAGRVGIPEDITRTVMFLCDAEAGFITGETITVDGGMSKLMIYHNDHGWTYTPEPIGTDEKT